MSATLLFRSLKVDKTRNCQNPLGRTAGQVFPVRNRALPCSSGGHVENKGNPDVIVKYAIGKSFIGKCVTVLNTAKGKLS